MFLRIVVGAVAGALVSAGFLVTLYELPGRTVAALCTGLGGRRCEA